MTKNLSNDRMITERMGQGFEKQHDEKEENTVRKPIENQTNNITALCGRTLCRATN